ncbi:LacI family DNA-binding transcriptional regulator [Ensifer sp. MPMI2T]|nr:LacI family DNA-binding transcriptional regulator [Ensifer sp. MPMI2T]
MRRKRGCTTVDIARALGVSTMSVSRALRGIELVREHPLGNLADGRSDELRSR